ncbi:VCBS repeat-containing protein [Fodinibius roseus]|uniref:VCBS repeat-containing protein n=1 Tax=Fodinibius roseus TaxID=1194090 RepID=UPI001114F8D3|nr:VCBS repeat-containing protein [Fodinibius roseus]
MTTEHTNINFENHITNTKELNIQNYGYFYDGGGVAVGDINNDGLADIYFVGNERANKLYLNKGDFIFKDITASAGVGGDTEGWSTGATMADINGDGYLDMYVSRVNYGNKTGANQLFINDGDNTFTESASGYGLDFKGYSTQAAFFDYDGDGDLDLYLLNHSFHSENTKGRAERLRAVHDSLAGDRLYRNDGDTFRDVTEQSGIYSSALGYGLGIAVTDINMDGWPDIYIGNDYHEDDYLYINRKDGTFGEALYASVGHTSKSSMGNDAGDLNNDGNVDLISLDMLPEDNEILRRSGILDSYERVRTNLRFGYNPQYSHNTLQLNRGDRPDGTPLFSDIGFAAGVAATDWSWSALIMDMDNDGLKDIFITNGMVGRPTDMDYNRLLQEKSRQISLSEDIAQENIELIEEMPPVKIPNYAYKNNGDITFTNEAQSWGLDQPGYSSGAAYADLNNNGRLDLVVNNVNMPAFVYRNTTEPSDSTNYLKVKLHGRGMNSSGIGAKVLLYKDNRVFFQEQMPTRGFQSSVDHILHVGLGHVTAIDSLRVIWPDHSFETMDRVQANQMLEIDQENAGGAFDYEQMQRGYDHALFREITDQVRLDFEHRENRFNDFRREPYLPYKMSTLGPAIARGDVNGDGRDDLFFGGAHGQPGQLFSQQEDGTFSVLSSNNILFELDRDSEDVSAIFFDANGDELPDLYVVSGGNEKHNNDDLLRDRLYINQGEGAFRKATGSLPDVSTNGSVVAAADYNGDGHTDLFVGSRKSWNYGLSPKSYLLKNDGTGQFTDVTESVAPELRKIGMVTDAQWADMTDSGYPDLVVVGEWMPVTIFTNDGKQLGLEDPENEFSGTKGLWSKLLVDDFNGDGLPDIIAGNFGKNSRLEASEENPLRLYTQDFVGSGQISSVIAYPDNGQYYPLEPLNEFLQQFRSLANEVATYTAYTEKSMEEIFGEKIIREAQVKEVNTLASLYIENRGDGSFNVRELPGKTQSAPVLAMHSGDFDGDGDKDLLLGGNLYDVKPSLGGRQDASYGLLLRGKGNGAFKALDMRASGFYVQGETRGIMPVFTSQDNSPLIVVVKNNQPPQIFGRNTAGPMLP